ncbi:hypothetical protein, partial [Mesorhizobium sp. M5C.F.Ca.IN.020.29.1.1]|uniref:hypothetical protein n=1 Tax=Mesorhizobium sp. M5C.F.Ca.IN.020.29.1.1 TaxID=2496770 RepID=UPI0019D13261
GLARDQDRNTYGSEKRDCTHGISSPIAKSALDDLRAQTFAGMRPLHEQSGISASPAWNCGIYIPQNLAGR